MNKMAFRVQAGYHQRMNRFLQVIMIGLIVTAAAMGPAIAEIAIEFTNPLLKAVNDQDYTRTYQLLVRGANPNAADPKGRTALILASQSGFVAGVTVLLENKANVRLTDQLGNTALMWASAGGFTEIVEALLAASSSVDAKNKEGQTALMLAAKYGQREILTLLLKAKASRDIRDLTGRTAADLARQGGHTAEERILLEKPK